MDEFIKKRNNDLVELKGDLKKKIKLSTDYIKREKDKVTKKIVSRKEIKKVAEGIENLRRKDEDTGFLKIIDKITYCYGIISLFVTFSLLFYPSITVFAYWIVFKNAMLILVRFISYRLKNWHYYYFDYCYYVSFGLWIYLLLFPKSETLFIMTFMNSMGPLLNYFLIFKGKLIFHNIESLTSFFMHYSPAMIMMTLRFFNSDKNSPYPLSQAWEAKKWEKGWYGALWVFSVGYSFYLIWCFAYYIFIFHLLKNRIDRKKRDTLYTYTTRDLKQFNSVIFKNGEKNGPISYMILHGLQGFLGCLGSLLFFYFKWATVIGLICYAIVPIWFSSTYYFDYFSRDYTEKLSQRAEQNKENRLKRSTSADGKRKLSE